MIKLITSHSDWVTDCDLELKSQSSQSSISFAKRPPRERETSSSGLPWRPPPRSRSRTTCAPPRARRTRSPTGAQDSEKKKCFFGGHATHFERRRADELVQTREREAAHRAHEQRALRPLAAALLCVGRWCCWLRNWGLGGTDEAGGDRLRVRTAGAVARGVQEARESARPPRAAARVRAGAYAVE